MRQILLWDGLNPSPAVKKSTKSVTFWIRRPPGGVGLFPHEGVVAEKFMPSLESLSSLGFEERNLACPKYRWDLSDSWGCSKSWCNKSSCAFFVPYPRSAKSPTNPPNSCRHSVLKESEEILQLKGNPKEFDISY